MKTTKVKTKKEKTISSKQRTKPAKILKAAVIGVGNMGRHHARNYAQLPAVDLVAISDLDERAGKKIANLYAAKYYKDYSEMLKREKPDIVTISTPTRWHHSVALDALEAGSNILIEKPISTNLEEAKEIIESAKGKKLKLTVGHIERFNPAVSKLKELIKEGKLGTIVSIMARRTGVVPARVKDANVVLDIGVHDIDLLNFILDGHPINVYASGGRVILRKHEDYADIFLEYPANSDGLKVTGHVQVNWLTPVKIRKLNVTGTKGYAVVNLITQDLILFDTQYTQEFDDFEDFVGKFKESKGKKIPVDTVEPLRLQLEHFVDSVANGNPPFVSAEDALHALRIATLATENIRLKEGRV
ncbi:MAG: Gfo/Idh/MocA family oxidoreductase [Candidatus Woykebacteria bacterium]